MDVISEWPLSRRRRLRDSGGAVHQEAADPAEGQIRQPRLLRHHKAAHHVQFGRGDLTDEQDARRARADEDNPRRCMQFPFEMV